MKTLTPFTHGLSNGASLTTDISGSRFNASYFKAVSSRYAQEEKHANDYMRGQKIGVTGAGIAGLVALIVAFASVVLWENVILAAVIAIAWQTLSLSNAFYAIRYESEFIQGKV